MTVVCDPSARDFLRHAGMLLYAREAENSLALGLAEGLESGLNSEMEPTLLRVVDEGRSVAVCVQTRPHNVVVSPLDDPQAAALATYLRDHRIPLNGAFGPAPGLHLLCRHYSDAPTRVLMSNRLLQLTRVIPPRSAPGWFRVATTSDFDVIKDHLHGFYIECLPHEMPTGPQLAQLAVDRISRGTIFLWEFDGAIVSTAHSTRPTRNGISISSVYTPPEYRGKGYASNIVAALSQHFLASGKRFCLLFADALNPTSNKIYESIGYRAIGTADFMSYS